MSTRNLHSHTERIKVKVKEERPSLLSNVGAATLSSTTAVEGRL